MIVMLYTPKPYSNREGPKLLQPSPLFDLFDLCFSDCGPPRGQLFSPCGLYCDKGSGASDEQLRYLRAAVLATTTWRTSTTTSTALYCRSMLLLKVWADQRRCSAHIYSCQPRRESIRRADEPLLPVRRSFQDSLYPGQLRRRPLSSVPSLPRKYFSLYAERWAGTQAKPKNALWSTLHSRAPSFAAARGL